MAAKKHNFTATEFKAGVLVIVSVGLLFLFVAVINGMRIPAPHKNFHAFLPDTKGLNQGAAVRYGGAKVGKVETIRVSPLDHSLIRIDFSVDADVPINEMSEAFVSSVSLTSEKHLEVSTGAKEAKLMTDGAEIPSHPGDIFEQADLIAGKIVSLLKKVDVLIGIEDVAPEGTEKKAESASMTETNKAPEARPAAGNTESKETVGKSAEPAEPAKDADGKEVVTIAQISKDVDDAVVEGHGLLKDVRDVIAKNEDDIKSILTKVQEVEDSAKKMADELNGILADNRPKITDAIGNAKDITARVKELSGKLDDIRKSLQATLDNAKTLSGDAQGLLERSRPNIEDMMLDLRETVRNLKSFSATIAEQPQSVVRGKTVHGRD